MELEISTLPIRKAPAFGGVNSTATAINTVAGATFEGYTNDGIPALTSSLFRPQDVAVDAAGNFHIADTQNNRIRKVTVATGIITTVAGNGMNGFEGDGGPATSARFSRPNAVAVDATGNFYISDQNNRIRKVDAQTGIITTVAGTGGFDFLGDGGPTTAAQIGSVSDVTTDEAGNIYIVANYRIRKIDVQTGIIATVAGSGSFSFSGDDGPATAAGMNPSNVTVDTNGNLFISDFTRVRRVDAATGIIQPIAGTGTLSFSGDGGPALNAALGNVRGLAVTPNDICYVTEVNNNRIRAITPFCPVFESVQSGNWNNPAIWS